MDLTEFLAARLDEAEAGAWSVHDVAKCDALLYAEDLAAAAARDPDCDCGYPARVLREVAAMRAILGLHHPTDAAFGLTYPEAAKFCAYCGPGDTWQAQQEPDHFPDALWPCLHVRLLAVIDSNHPDYNEAWAVT